MRFIHWSVQELLNKRGNSFEHAVIHRVSVAASPLAAWVKANLEYSAVLIRIQPLQDENDRLQARATPSAHEQLLLGRPWDAAWETTHWHTLSVCFLIMVEFGHAWAPGRAFWRSWGSPCHL